MSRVNIYKSNISLFTTPVLLLLSYLVLGDQLAVSWIVISCSLVGISVFYRLRYPNKRIAYSPTDYTIVLMLFVQLIGLRYTSYFTNSLESTLHFVSMMVVYFFIRSCIVKKEQIHFLIQGFAVLFGLLSLFTLFSFSMFKFNVEYEGFSDLINFKNLYHPLGKLSNLWSSYLLLFLPFPMIAFVHCKKKVFKWINGLSSALIILACIVSFSRGTYLSLFAFILTFIVVFWVWRIKPIKHLWIIRAVIGIITLGGLLFATPVADTLAYNKTTSQVRSISGRQDLWGGVWQMVTDNPVWGVGQGNATLNFNAYLTKSEDTFYTNRVTNSLLQLLAEQGIIGLLFWGCLVFFILRYLWLIGTNKNGDIEWRLSAVVFISGIAAFFVREMTFSSFFDAPKLQVLLFILFAIVINIFENHSDDNIGDKSHTKSLSKALMVFLFMSVVLSGFYSFKMIKASQNNDQFIEHYEIGEYSESIAAIDKAISNSPKQALFYAHKALALASDSIAQYSKAIAALEKAVVLSPNDAMFQHNLGSLHLQVGDSLKAHRSLGKAVELDPYNALYIISFLEPEGGVHSTINAIKYSPEILDSPYGIALKEKPEYSAIYDSLKVWAVANETNPIIAARKAKVRFSFGNIKGAKALFDQVTSQLPNLNRPWCYLGQIELLEGDTASFKRNMARSLLLDSRDYLPNKVLANYKLSIKDYTDAMYYYKTTLNAFVSINSLHSVKTRGYYSLPTVGNDVFPSQKLPNIKPYLDIEEVLQNLIHCFKMQRKENEILICQAYLDGDINLTQLLEELREITK